MRWACLLSAGGGWGCRRSRRATSGAEPSRGGGEPLDNEEAVAGKMNSEVSRGQQGGQALEGKRGSFETGFNILRFCSQGATF